MKMSIMKMSRSWNSSDHFSCDSVDCAGEAGSGREKGDADGSAKGLTHHCHRSRTEPPQRIWHLSTRQRGHPRTCLTFYLRWQKRRKQQKAHHSGASAVWAPSLLLWLSPLETCQTLEENFHVFKAFNCWVYE